MRVIKEMLSDIESKTFDLGFVGEKNHTCVMINCVSLFNQYPDAVVTMVARPPVGDIYPVVLHRDGVFVVWNISESDIANAGSGQYQLTFTDGEGDNAEIIKTVFGSFSVKPSMVSNGEPPEPIEDWLEEANEALAEFGKINELSASATTLPAGQQATAEITNVNGHKNIVIGIPKGDKGDKGDDGDPAPAEEVTAAVDAYLAENFSNPSNPPLDRSLSSSSSAAPADLVGDLKSALTGAIYKKGYIKNNGTSIGSFTSNNSYRCLTIPVNEGEVYSLYGSGASTARLWSIHGNDGVITRVAASSLVKTPNSPEVLTIQSGETYLVFNTEVSASAYGVDGKDASGSPIIIREMIDKVKNDITDLTNRINTENTKNIILNSNNLIKTGDLVSGRYIKKNDGTVRTSADYCISGYLFVKKSVYVLTFDSSSSNAGYCFYDKDKTIISNSWGDIYSISGAYSVINVPDNAVYFRISCLASKSSLFEVYTDINDSIEFVYDSSKYVKQIRNNLYSDGTAFLPDGTTITKNGTASINNYGVDGAEYKIPHKHVTTHVYFEFQFTEPLSFESPSTFDNTLLINAYNNASKVLMYTQTMVFQNGTLYSRVVPRVYTGSQNIVPEFETGLYESIQGSYAISIQYTNEVTNSSSGTITFNKTSCEVVIDGISATIQTSTSMTIEDFITALNNINGIEAKAIHAAGKTYGDLAPVAVPVATTKPIQMIYSGTRSIDQTAYYDNPPVYIPLAMDDRWHSMEIIIDFENGFTATAYDGLTFVQNHSGISASDNIIIGEDGGKVRIRNLEIDFDSYGDAEIIDAYSSSIYNTKKQLISVHNPKLLVYEGHGIQNKSEAQMPTGDDVMDCSIERLNILFDTARSKGYIPVTWWDVIQWKLGYKTLPKRCFTMMFDDWRFDNYVAYALRKPFVNYDVKPGLATITGTHPLTETFVIDGETYTAQQMVEMTMKAGWYPSSHTHMHRHNNNCKPTEMIDLLKTDVIEANKYGIYSNIITYPYGECYPVFFPILKNSDFAIGVAVVGDYYNCRAINTYRLVRVELGNRVPLSEALAPLV